jgi:uncharacterized protein (DUF58 family)
VEGTFGGTRLGVAFGPRFFVLLGAGLLWLAPALADVRFLYAMLAWDLLVLTSWLIDAVRLPNPRLLSVRRTWLAPAALSLPSAVRLTFINGSGTPVHARLVDAVPEGMRPDPPVVTLFAARLRGSAAMAGQASDGSYDVVSEAEGEYELRPRRRGRMQLGRVFLQYQSPWRIAERWAVAALAQEVVIYPNLEEARRESIYLARSRQAELRRRARAIRGAGRVFESLREYQEGDEFRDICWTASARRAKLVTRTYEIERSQPIWVVVDAGRLMRTRVADVTKMDQAVNAALTLAQVALGSGDRVGLITYARTVVHYLPAARGSEHLRQILDRLADVRAETSEADHWQAAARLLGHETRRSLVVWLTDVPDSAMTPEVVQAAASLTSRHLVLFVMLGQADLHQIAARRPESAGQLYESAAAQEVVHRREILLARLRAGGALTLDVSRRLSPRLVNAYLEVKQRGRL